MIGGYRSRTEFVLLPEAGGIPRERDRLQVGTNFVRSLGLPFRENRPLFHIN